MESCKSLPLYDCGTNWLPAELQFLKAFKRNDKNMAVGCLKFIAHLCNQQVAHEALALEILVLLLDSPTDDSVEVALEFASDVAALLEEASPASFTM